MHAPAGPDQMHAPAGPDKARDWPALYAGPGPLKVNTAATDQAGSDDRTGNRRSVEPGI